MKRAPFLLLLSIVVSFLLRSQSAYLTVQHPQQTWRSGTGTIERVTWAIHEHGIYTEHHLYLEFSAAGLSFTAADSVEVQYLFDLPSGAIVTDLWLWVGNDIMRGLLLDRWTASGIYENIVKRRRDPALLTKEYGDRYQLRVYPMRGNETRRVKIAYLLRSNWTNRSIGTSVPVYLLRASRSWPAKTSFLFWPVRASDSPRLSELPGITASSRIDSAGVPFFEMTALGSIQPSLLSLTWPSRMSGGIYAAFSQTGSDGVYQIATIPSQAISLVGARKVAICFDFDATKSSQTAAEALSAARSALLDNLTPADSFNLVFSNVPIRRVSEQWIGGDSASIVQAFATAGPSPMSNYSNLPSLLADGISFLTNNRGGSLWLIGNSDQAGDYLVANPLLNDLLAMMPSRFPVFVSDYNNSNVRYFYFSGTAYQGNQYLYQNLARLTQGNNRRIASGASLTSFFAASLADLRGTMRAFDLYTSLSAGFCYGRQMLGTIPLQSVGLDQAVYQTGKFTGSLPLLVDISGSTADSTMFRRFVIDQGDDIGSTARQAWAGPYVVGLEAQPVTNDMTNQILAVSFGERILSKYSAFLALEPSDSVQACLTCVDESKLTGITNMPTSRGRSDSTLQAYPNPFNTSTTLRVRLPAGVDFSAAGLAIYNVLGQRIRTIDLGAFGGRESGTIIWNGTSDAGQTAASGVYYAVLTTPMGRFGTKLLLLK